MTWEMISSMPQNGSAYSFSTRLRQLTQQPEVATVAKDVRERLQRVCQRLACATTEKAAA